MVALRIPARLLLIGDLVDLGPDDEREVHAVIRGTEYSAFAKIDVHFTDGTAMRWDSHVMVQVVR